MKKLVFTLLILMTLMGLHCYALHKRIAYLNEELSITQQDFTRFLRESIADHEERIQKLKEGGK